MKKTLAILLAVLPAITLAGRNSSGTYSLPAGTPFVSGTSISSTVMNNVQGDIATELSDSLSRSGKGGMLSPLRTPDGSFSAPAHSFTNETGSGWYRAGAADVRLSVVGTDRCQVTPTGLTVNGQFAATSGALSGKATSAATVAGDSSTTLATKGYVDGSQFRFVRKTSDQSTSSSAGTDVTGMAFSVSASGEYEWEATLILDKAVASSETDVWFTGPASPTYVLVVTNFLNSSGAFAPAVATAFGSTTVAVSGTNAGPYIITMRGYLRNGVNAGTVQMRFKSLDNTNAVTVKQGTTITYHRIDAIE